MNKLHIMTHKDQSSYLHILLDSDDFKGFKQKGDYWFPDGGSSILIGKNFLGQSWEDEPQEVVIVRVAKVNEYDDGEDIRHTCDKCLKPIVSEIYHYCPNCGSKLIWSEE